jgi:hypothetical protein
MQIFRPQTVQQALSDVSMAQNGDVVHMPVASMGRFVPGKIASGVTLQAGTYTKIECSSDGVIFDRPTVLATGQGYNTFGIILTGNDCVIKFATIDNRDGTVWTVRDWRVKACGGIMLRGHRNKVVGGNLYNVRHGVVPHDQGSASNIEGVHIDGVAGDSFRLNQNGMRLALCRAVNFKAVDGNHDDGAQSFAIDPTTGRPTKSAAYSVDDVIVDSNTFLASDNPKDEIWTRTAEPGAYVLDQPPLSSLFQGIVMFNGKARRWKVTDNLIVSSPWKHGISLANAEGCFVTDNTVVDGNPAYRGDQVQIAVQRNNGNVVTGNTAPRINPFWPGNTELPPSEYVNFYMDPANLDFRPKGSGPKPAPVPAPAPTPTPVVVNEPPVGDTQKPLPLTDEPSADDVALKEFVERLDMGLAMAKNRLELMRAELTNLTGRVAALENKL